MFNRINGLEPSQLGQPGGDDCCVQHHAQGSDSETDRVDADLIRAVESREKPAVRRAEYPVGRRGNDSGQTDAGNRPCAIPGKAPST